MAEGVISAIAAEDVAKHQARARIEAAKAEERAGKWKASAQESSKILSVSDRPAFNIDWEIGPGLTVRGSISLMTIYGLMAAQDINEQYEIMSAWRQAQVEVAREQGISLPLDMYDDAVQTTNILQGLLATVPLEPSALAFAAGAFDEGGSVPTVRTEQEIMMDELNRIKKGMFKGSPGDRVQAAQDLRDYIESLK